ADDRNAIRTNILIFVIRFVSFGSGSRKGFTEIITLGQGSFLDNRLDVFPQSSINGFLFNSETVFLSPTATRTESDVPSLTRRHITQTRQLFHLGFKESGLRID